MYKYISSSLPILWPVYYILSLVSWLSLSYSTVCLHDLSVCYSSFVNIFCVESGVTSWREKCPLFCPQAPSNIFFREKEKQIFKNKIDIHFFANINIAHLSRKAHYACESDDLKIAFSEILCILFMILLLGIKGTVHEFS